MKTTTTRHKLIAFLPAMLAIGLMALVVSGVSLIPSAGAANTVNVGGTVTAGMSTAVDTSDGNCTTGNQSVGNFSDGAFHAAVGTCMLTFGTNSVNGASLTIRDNDGALPFFCTAACGVGANNSVASPSVVGGGGEALGDGQIGVALTAVGGTPAPTAGAEFTIDSTPGTQTGGETIWGPIAATDTPVCGTAAVTTVNQTCTLRFGIDGKGATQTSGTYAGVAYINATAL